MIDESDSSTSNKDNQLNSTVPEISVSGFEAWNKSYVGDPFKFIVSKNFIGIFRIFKNLFILESRPLEVNPNNNVISKNEISNLVYEPEEIVSVPITQNKNFTKIDDESNLYTNGLASNNIETNGVSYNKEKKLNTVYNYVDYSGDADKVLTSGSGLKSFRNGISASFEIDTANAGKQTFGNQSFIWVLYFKTIFF